MPTTTCGRRPRQTLSPEERAARLAAAREQLVTGVDALLTSDGWQQLIESRRWLRKYSLNNQLMILMQCPQASDVRPLSAWNAAGCRMRRGTKQIKIWAPGGSRRTAAADAQPDNRATSEKPTSAIGSPSPRFVLVNAVDVSQLANPPEQADLGPAELHGEAPDGLWDDLAPLVTAEGFTIERGSCDGLFGQTNFPPFTVRVRADVDPAQATKTLCHELAHILCDHEHRDVPRPVGQVEAESVACIVAAVVGLDTLGYSVPYVAGWAGDRDTARASAERVLAVADQILTRLGAPAAAATAA